MIAKALVAATPTLRDIAERVGVSYHAVRSWRLKNRTPPARLRRHLAESLRQQAADLEKLAEQLEQSAEQEP